jgi:virginiamycin B lyase
MRKRRLCLLASAIASGLVLQSGMAVAQAGAALSGHVASAEEGQMEGVLVNVKKDRSNITTTVVTDEKGAYSFPAERLEPGRYTISIRAGGYVLAGPESVEIPAGGNAQADLTLAKAGDLAAQLSNAEWLISLPGKDDDKRFLNDCVGCHTLYRVVTSPHTVEGWKQVFARMAHYSPGSSPQKPQPLVPDPRNERPRVAGDRVQAAAEYLASVSLANPEGTHYDLKTLPRPKGRATRVLITEYDLPRKDASPHDVIVDADGMAWYIDFADQFAGVLDPKSGKVTDIAIPLLRPEQPKGGLDMEFDPWGNVWLALMYQAAIAKIDAKTRAVKVYGYPKAWQTPSSQANMVSPQHADIDGKVWVSNHDDDYNYRFDLKTETFENLGQAKDPGGKLARAYGIPTDQRNDVYELEFGGTSIGLRDAKTDLVTIYPTPTPASRPRRGRVDEQNRLWFGEYGGDRIGRFDPKTKQIKEWQVSVPWSAPYDVVANSDASEAWTGSMLNDYVTRLNAKTGDMVNYLLPRTTNIRRVFLDERGRRPVFWVGSNLGASIVRVEPLD